MVQRKRFIDYVKVQNIVGFVKVADAMLAHKELYNYSSLI
jgi:hypothetical protein